MATSRQPWSQRKSSILGAFSTTNSLDDPYRIDAALEGILKTLPTIYYAFGDLATLSTGPLLRLALLRLDGEHHLFLRTLHHIVADGSSEKVFYDELAQL